MNRPVIAVDIDDVLKESSQLIVDYSNEKWGTNLTLDDYTEHWAKMWQVDHQNHVLRSDRLHQEKILVHGKPFPETERVLHDLSETYDLIVATSREKLISEDTRDWLEQNFEGVFSGVHFAGIWDDRNIDGAQKVKATKASLLQKTGAQYLIDDQLKHCLAAAEIGIEALLFGNYPWNQSEKLPARITRVKGWKEVEEYFRGRTD